MKKEPQNSVIPDEVIGAYKDWLEKIQHARDNLFFTDEITLYSVAMCKLLANSNCKNRLQCATCPAAQESLVWARNMMNDDRILYTDTPHWPAYSSNIGHGIIALTEALFTKHHRMIRLEVDDGRYKLDDQKGMVTISVL